jgi:KAP family P-loop domain
MTTPLWSDNPTALDLLGFADVTAPIAEAVLRDKLDPVTVGIEGDWGSGKSSILEILEAELRKDASVVVIPTHPWEYDPATDPKATLIAEVLNTVRREASERQGGWDKLSQGVQDRFKALARRVKLSKVIKLATNSVLSMGLPKIDDVIELFGEEEQSVEEPTRRTCSADNRGEHAAPDRPASAPPSARRKSRRGSQPPSTTWQSSSQPGGHAPGRALLTGGRHSLRVMSSAAAAHDHGSWPFIELQDLVDEFLCDPEALEDVAELEHAALVLRAPFDARGAPCAVAADLALALERRDDELAAGMLAALATFSHEPLASEAAGALARLSARGRISALAGQIGKLELIDASCHRVAGLHLVVAQLQRPSESRAQVAMVAFDAYPCGTVISHLEVTPPRQIETAHASLRAPVRGSTPYRVQPSELLDRLHAAADHMDAHDVALDSEAAVWLPALARALTGTAGALPQLAVEQPGPADGPGAEREPLAGARAGGGETTRGAGGDRRQAKRRAARAARRRNRS